MSDPVTNVEVEDVLSSIRRLVSQEGGERPAVLAKSDAENPVSKDEAAPAAADALVLTENHRVDLEDDEIEPQAVPMEEARREAASAVRSELERAIEELEAAMGIAEQRLPKVAKAPVSEPEAEEASDSDVAEETTSDLDWEAPVGRAMDGVPPGFDAEEDSSEDEEPSTEAAELAEDHFEYEPAPEEGEATAVEEAEGHVEADSEQSERLIEDSAVEEPEVEAEEAQLSEHEEVEEATEDAPAEDVETSWEIEAAEPAAEPAADDDFAQEAENEAEEVAAVEDSVDDEEEAVAAVFRHNAVERLHLVSGEHDADEDTFSGPYDETYEVEGELDHIPARVEAALADRADDFDVPQPPFDDTKDDPFPGTQVDDAGEAVVALDEEQLRDMVAEIVREELQGELGERITRNVRKLVRREINRALAGQDLI